ncbi:MAG: hypothetical protein AB1351_07835 [Thermoproteota archaeon]
MQARNLLTFMAMAVLVGAIVSMTTSGVFAQTQNDDPYKGSIIDRILAQQGSNNSGNNDNDAEEEDCVEEEEGEGEEDDTDEAEDEDEEGDVDEEDSEECEDEDEDEAGDVDEEDNEEGSAEKDTVEGEKLFTTSFMAESCTFSSTGTNPFFILEPGYQQVFRGEDDGEPAELIITVLNETKVVNGIETRVVEEKESVDGELVELARNFFAICEETNSVFYFGEEVDDYEDGEIVGHSGEWLVGENDAKAGIIMPGTILLGSRYHQEIAPGVAMDRAEIVSMDETVETPAGTFENVLAILETTPLEPDASEIKYYAAGIGLLQDQDLKLEEYGFVE